MCSAPVGLSDLRWDATSQPLRWVVSRRLGWRGTSELGGGDQRDEEGGFSLVVEVELMVEVELVVVVVVVVVVVKTRAGEDMLAAIVRTVASLTLSQFLERPPFCLFWFLGLGAASAT